MAEFFIVIEIAKIVDLFPTWFYAAPFTYGFKISTKYDYSSFFTTLYLAEDRTNKETLNIKQIIIKVVNNYSKQNNFNDCKNNIESFYLDADEQILYIHFLQSVNPMTASVEIGKVIGYTNDTVREFNQILYKPEIISIPNFRKGVDPLQYKRQAFFGGTINMKNYAAGRNDDGEFDTDANWFGNLIFAFIGNEGDTYDELFPLFVNYITNYLPSLQEVNFVVKDLREQQSIKIPVEQFNTTDYPDINADLVGKIKPDAYGFCTGVPGICINEDSGSSKVFRFASTITGTPTVYAKKNEKWEVVTPTAIDGASGTVTLANADAYVDGSTSNGLNDIKATGTFRDISNPGDIIIDLNDRYLNVLFNASNYDTVEWAAESAYLADIGLYIDEAKNIFELIEDIQNGSQVGFQYDIENGFRTLRLDNPNRDTVRDISAIEILNNAILPVDTNGELFATRSKVNYNKDYTDDFLKTVSNTEFEDEVYKIHRTYEEFEIDTLLISEDDAQDKADLIMDDQKEPRPIFEIVVNGKEYFDLRIYDIINAEISFPGQRIGIQENDAHTVIDDPLLSDHDFTVISSSLTNNSLIVVDSEKSDIISGYRAFYGWQRCQIIGLIPDLQNGNLTIRLRQRDYSAKFEEVTGYIP